MFFVLVAKLPRLTINIARYPLSSVATRSFIASPRVAYANSKTSPHPTTEQSHSPAPAKRGRKPKEQASKEKPKKIVIPEDMKPPKTPGTPYALYMKDFFEKSPKPSNRDETHALFKQCGVEWKALADAEKERYRETYRRNREEFNEKKEEWFKNTDPEMLKAINAARKKSGKPRLVPNDKPKSSKPLVPFFQCVPRF
ncbi:hypothetical protein AX14_006618 [Amanita brunnescens Koide BX004]|nr:hypothetical protein AX14_006618 [Amanita brunnescens Koide BX004]